MPVSRAEISARLKAARWIASEETGEDDKPKALAVAALIEREPLKKNDFKQNRVEDIEQGKVDPRPWELEHLAKALGLPYFWFSEPDLAKLIRLLAESLPQRDDPDAQGLVAVLEAGALQYEPNASQPGEQEPGVPKSAEE